MLITFTPEEEKKLAEIRAKYEPERKELAEKYKELLEDKSGEAKAERLKINLRQQTVIDSMIQEVEAYMHELEAIRFEDIKKGGAAVVIKHATAQAPELLEFMRRQMPEARYYKDLEDHFLKSIGISRVKGNTIYFRSSYAKAYIKQELHLHLSFLQDDAEALQKVQRAIQEAVKKAPFVDQVEDTEETIEPILVSRLIRNPLGDITTFGLMNDKINAQLVQSDLFKQEANGQLTLKFAVNQAPQKQKQVPVYVALTYEGTEGKLTKRLTSFDSAVYNAVSTRFYYWRQENGNAPLYITPQEIWRTMNGKKAGDGNAKPRDTQIKKICDSLDKMRFTHFYMDITEEIKAFDLFIDDERVISGKIDTYVLNSSMVEFMTEKGRVVKGYRIGEEPILYTYNRIKDHLLYVPYEMLDTSSQLSNSEYVPEFRNYLLQQIQLMKNAAENPKGKYFHRNNIILLDTIYRDTGILPPEERITEDFKNEASKRAVIRRNRKADREKIEGLLEAWKEKNWIKGYIIINSKNQPIKEKQQAKGYEILL